MVARITTPANLQETLNYNEHKVRKGVAECIAENNFMLPVNCMNFYHKLDWFENRNALNDRASTKTIHISLNFHPSENFSDEKLSDIAVDYMTRIGFGDQPYLVYKHKDAGHPHIHIVGTTIRDDGTRINTHNIGRNQSETARRLLEEKYQLVPARKQNVAKTIALNSFNLSRVEYGKSETKRGISNILCQVINLYSYTSLPEFNAVLRQFSIVADRGNEGSFTHRKNGLLYRVLDTNLNPIGVPIKASTIAGKPTLSYLQKRCEINSKHREILQLSLRKNVDAALAVGPLSIADLVKQLESRNIYTVLRQNGEGRIYGITFVDNQNRSVFNGSQLGKEYSISGLYKQMNSIETKDSGKDNNVILHNQPFLSTELSDDAHTIIDHLFSTDQQHTETPFQLRKRKKKKRKL